MGNRSFRLGCAIAVIILAGMPLVGQEKPWTAPRTADSQPDLQGFWTNAPLTPLERPTDLAGKRFFSDEEAQTFMGQAAEYEISNVVDPSFTVVAKTPQDVAAAALILDAERAMKSILKQAGPK